MHWQDQAALFDRRYWFLIVLSLFPVNATQPLMATYSLGCMINFVVMDDRMNAA
ncbi:hypothetical protein CFter6_0546 [Collimonas fungivorans]|uniref:Uncharacterized protein n=1 Tax=Collimonas fungivorans TaxID=158899 RepID=A0A127P6K0_9BURK|nr:hypothetical protein CFter6_0546 [Collimonas fungivorans]